MNSDATACGHDRVTAERKVKRVWVKLNRDATTSAPEEE